MKALKRSKTIIMISLCVAVFISAGITNESAAADAVSVTKITRLSHPAYNMHNLWHGSRNPWNKGYTRIMLNESFKDSVHYSAAPNGRGLVWGYINTLKSISGGSLTDYLNATYDIPDNYSIYAEWSIFDGEENIIYAVNKRTNMVVKYNVDTQVETNIISYNPGDGTNISKAGTVGWTRDNKLIVNFVGSPGSSFWSSGGYEIDVLNKTRKSYNSWPARCTSDNHRFPYPTTAIHGDASKDGLYRTSYHSNKSGSGIYINDPNDPNCNPNSYPSPIDYADINNTDLVNHVSWGANDEWYVGSNSGDYFGVCSGQYHNGTNPPPYLDTCPSMRQIIFNRTDKTFTHNILFYQTTAGFRRTTMGDGDHNYSAMISPTLRDDSAQIMFSSTGEKYSFEDKTWCDNFSDPICSDVNANYGTTGTWVADLSTNSGSGSGGGSSGTVPSPPTGLSIE